MYFIRHEIYKLLCRLLSPTNKWE